MRQLLGAVILPFYSNAIPGLPAPLALDATPRLSVGS
jgi:hypothetical protein